MPVLSFMSKDDLEEPQSTNHVATMWENAPKWCQVAPHGHNLEAIHAAVFNPRSRQTAVQFLLTIEIATQLPLSSRHAHMHGHAHTHGVWTFLLDHTR